MEMRNQVFTDEKTGQQGRHRRRHDFINLLLAHHSPPCCGLSLAYSWAKTYPRRVLYFFCARKAVS